MNRLRMALSLLTVIPVRLAHCEPGDAGRSAPWFPVVGLLIGALLLAAYLALIRLFPPLLTAALVVALWAAITGGLHLDGLADCGDGLLAPVSKERRLEIMKDPRVGAFGAISLVLYLIVKVATVAALPASGSRLLGLLLAPVTARWLCVLASLQPSARPGGMGADFRQGVTRASLWLAALPPLALALLGGLRGMAALALAVLAFALVTASARRKLGGLTGDVYGLVVEVSEVCVLLVYAVQPKGF